MEKILYLDLKTKNSTERIKIPVRRVILAGLSGRNEEEIERHLKELKSIGIPPPEKTPMLMRVSVDSVTTGNSIEVQGEKTSGEVEYVCLFKEDKIIITVGSDHSDFELEKFSAKRAKQIAPKVICPQAWDYSEIVDHRDDLILRSWIDIEGNKVLYQEEALSAILSPEELVEVVKERIGSSLENTVIFSGTVPTGIGVKPTTKFWMELDDPVLRRNLAHSYSIDSFPGYY